MSDPEQQEQEVYGLFEKAQTVDPEVRAHVYSLVTALGGTGVNENGDYVLGDDGLACLRDLKRWLKIYDEKTNRLDVARCLAEADLVIGDLLPILSTWTEDAASDPSKPRIALACLELLVPLTWPLENTGEMTVNHHRHTPFIQQAQVRYKASILGYGRANILRTIVRIGVPSIAVSKEDRTSRDEGIIKLLLYCFRNISIISPAPNLPSQGFDNEISRSATIEAFRQQDVFALLLTLCSNMGEDFNLQDVILLDTIFNLIKGVNVEQLFMNDKQRKTQKMTDLKDALGKEKGMHRDYTKVAPTRHGRFGTMIWVKRENEKVASVSGQDNLKDDRNSLLKMDKSKKWNKPQQRRKDLAHSIHDFDRSVRLNSLASELLRNFVEEFLDSGFNPLFTHLRKAIEREADRLLDVNYRQFFYTVSWFLQAERCRRARQKKDRENQKVQTEFEAESYGLVAGVLNQETFIAINRYMQTSLENKEWQDLNASMKCFTQILLTVQEMAQSRLEDDQEIADNIQNRIFYEEITHDRIASVLKGFKDQGFGYLDACTELSHVFLRMLERYSKENTDLQIRSRKRARRKKKDQKKKRDDGTVDQEGGSGGAEDEDAQSEAEEVAEAAQVSRERSFDFTRFAAKFASQNTIDTFVAFTAFYRDLSVDQLKRAHRFFHRIAFKQELAVLLFRVDIIALFYRMVKGPEGLDRSHAMFKEWDELVRQVLKKMFKKLEQRPELMVEMLFSKIRATMYYLEYGHEKHTGAAKRAPTELEVKPAPGRDVNEQIGIMIAVLLQDDQERMVRWVLDSVGKACEERKAWETLDVAEKDQSTPQEADTVGKAAAAEISSREEPKAPVIVLPASTAEIRTSTAQNARLKLLLRLCGFQRLSPEDKPEIPWVVPSHLTSDHLQHTQSAIEKHLEIVWTDPDGNHEPQDFLRRVKQPTRAYAEDGDDNAEPRRDAFIDDSEGSEDDDQLAAMFPANVRSKSDALDALKQKHKDRKLARKRKSNANDNNDEDRDLLDERKRAREQAALDRRRKIKSGLYIHDSDEEMDEDENLAFFAREEENRRRQTNRVFNALRERTTLEGDTVRRSKKRKANGEAGEEAVPGRTSRDEAQDNETDEEDAHDTDNEMIGIDSDAPPSSSPNPTPTSSKVDHRRRNPEEEEEEEEGEGEEAGEDTPISSQSPASDPQSTTKRPSTAALQEMPQPRIPPSSNSLSKGLRGVEMEEMSGGEAEDLEPTSSRVRQGQRVRAGFILDDSDDE